METLRSTYADDEEMVSLVELFTSDLPGQVAELEALLDDESLELLRRKAHQLKGSGGGYGFQIITQRAAEVERTIEDGGQIDDVRQQVNSLIETLRRVEGYDPGLEQG